MRAVRALARMLGAWLIVGELHRSQVGPSQDEDWDGHPVELGDAWILRKGNKVARCILVTHPLGWELRLMTPDLLRSQVCRSPAEILDKHERWKAAMLQGMALSGRESDSQTSWESNRGTLFGVDAEL